MEFWDALTGLGTIALAIATFTIIKQGTGLRKDDERHHQEQFRLVCVLIRPSFSDPRSSGNQLIVVNPNVRPNLGQGLLYIKLALKNIGAGPALNLRISIRMPDMDGLHLNRFELAPLAPQEIIKENSEFCIPINLFDQFNQTDFQSIEGQRWEIILEYEDVFGNSFYSIHRKPPAEPWVSIHKGNF